MSFADVTSAYTVQRWNERRIGMADCIFCMIAPKKFLRILFMKTIGLFVFMIWNRRQPVHVLIIPKEHIASLDEVEEDDEELLGYLMTKVKKIAEDLELENGYRLVNNCGEDGMQTVKHLHFHLLGKRKLTWPPG